MILCTTGLDEISRSAGNGGLSVIFAPNDDIGGGSGSFVFWLLVHGDFVPVAEKCEGDINSGWGGELSSGILDLRGGKNGGLLPSEECLVLRNMFLYFSH